MPDEVTAQVKTLTRVETLPPPQSRVTAPPRLAMSAVIPLMDAAALVAAILVFGRLDPMGWAFAAGTFAVLGMLGTQTPGINPRVGDSVGKLIAAVAITLVGVALLAPSAAETGRFLVLGPVTMGLLIPARGLAYALIRAARSQGLIQESTLILGAGEVGQTVATTLLDHPEYGLIPLGFVDDVPDVALPLPVMGGTDHLEAAVREFAVRRVIVAFGMTREPEMVEVLRTCDRLPVEVHLVPRFFELGVSSGGPFTDEVWGIPLIRLRRAALRSFAWRTKRLFDLVVSTALLVLTSPLLLLLATAIRLSSPGPVLFRQLRIGQRGVQFNVLKFRTMRVNERSDTEWSGEGEWRVTALGRFLRRTSLDELPQLFNVVRGHMSLIGPRPERPFFVDRFTSEVARYEDRHRVPVGITGWAQVHGLRGDTSIPERVRFDNYYVEHWSLWTDIVILARTIWVVTTGRH
jgi:exopolysaccharide biosynthesis polyprenyl glycosylphosphotransferase